MNGSNQTVSSCPTSSWEEAPAKTSQWLESVQDWVENAVDCSTNNAESLMRSLPTGFAGRTSLALSHPTEDTTSLPYSQDSQDTPLPFLNVDGEPEGSVSDRDGLRSGVCLTLRTSESHSGAVACSLSQVLEPWHDELLRFCLSPKAASGILRRAENRGRTLPPRLVDALRHLAGGGLTEIAQCLSTRQRDDLDTGSFVLDNAEPLQDVVGTLSPGAHGSGPGTVNGQDAYTGQLVPVRVWAGSAQQDDVAAPLLNAAGGGGRGPRTSTVPHG